MTSPCWVYGFDQPLPPDCNERQLLGAKSQGLRRLLAYGVAIPPGFTITTDACQRLSQTQGMWPAELREQVDRALEQLEHRTARRLGDARQPLRLAIRSGAAQSMPGMLATVLHCGSSRPTDCSAQSIDAWQAYLRFAQSLATAAGSLPSGRPRQQGSHPQLRLEENVHGVTESCHVVSDLCQDLADIDQQVTENCQMIARRCEQLERAYERHTGRRFPCSAREALDESIEVVCRSWNAPRAVAYRQATGISSTIGTAVTVQVMIEADASGVVFSRDPLKDGERVIVIEAVGGFGDALVSGTVTPDQYRIPWDDLAIEQPGSSAARRVPLVVEATGPVSAEQVERLAELARQLDERCSEPLDIEWALADDQFWLLQARTLDLEASGDLRVLVERERRVLQQLAAHRTRVWVRHNLQETLPWPTPMTWGIVERLMGPRGGYMRMYQQLGYPPPPRGKDNGYLQLILGRIYCDPDRLAAWLSVGLPLRYDLTALSQHPERLETSPSVLEVSEADPLLLLRLPAIAWRLWRIRRRTRQLAPVVRERFEQQTVPELLAYVETERQRDLESLSTAALIQLFEQRWTRVVEQLAAETLLPGLFGGLAYAQFTRQCAQLLGPKDGPLWAQRLTRRQATVSSEADWCARYAAGQCDFEQLLEHVGHRAVGEMELARPRWREMPEQLVAFARCTAGAPAQMGDTDEESEALWQEFLVQLRQHGAFSFSTRLRRLAREARELLPYRDKGRYYWMMAYELLRDILTVLGRRSHLNEDVFFLDPSELEMLARPESPPRLAELAARRRSDWLRAQRVQLPAVMYAESIDQLGTQPDLPTDPNDRQPVTVLTGGRASGAVRMVGFETWERMDAGTVLVSRALEPALAPLLARCAALIVEQGGQLSHGAIVARQLGIPAVVCPGALRWLREGDSVYVDGESGYVYRQRPAT